jgi:hypothetical protein
MRLQFVAMLESACGPSRHFEAARQLGRFWREADINWRARSAGSVANDPKRHPTRCGRHCHN